MYHDTKTAQDRLGRTAQPQSKLLTTALVILMATLLLGAMHADHYALTHGLI